MQVRSLFKTVFWVVAVLSALIVVAALALAAINWKDKRPSPQAQQLDKLLDARPTVGAAKNGFAYMLALDVPPGHDVIDVGSARMAWLGQRVAQNDFSSTKFPDGLEHAAPTPSAEFAPLLAACHNVDEACAQAMRARPALVEEWLTTEKWLSERYDGMLATAAWSDGTLIDPALPTPAFAMARHGQRQLFMRALLSAEKGDTAAAQALLARDIVFWRTVQASSTSLIGKLTATAAITRHFQWASPVLRTLPPAKQTSVIPVAWREPFSAAELGMHLAMAGEYKWLQRSLTRVEKTEQAKPWPKSMLYRLSGFQKQDSVNRYAAHVMAVADATNVPFAHMPAALGPARALQPDTGHKKFLDQFYNMAGKAVMAAPTDFSSYSARVADLEGVRRAALVTAQLRAENVTPAHMPARLASAQIRDPYTDKPFSWVEGTRSVLFTGLADGERGRVSIAY